jgi:hypothetical protein
MDEPIRKFEGSIGIKCWMGKLVSKNRKGKPYNQRKLIPCSIQYAAS